MCLVVQLCLTLCDPTSLLSPGKNTRVGCQALLQGIFPTQGSNPGLLHCRQILYCLSYQGSPFIHSPLSPVWIGKQFHIMISNIFYCMIIGHYYKRSWEKELGWAESRPPGHYSLGLELSEWGILILSLQRQWN